MSVSRLLPVALILIAVAPPAALMAATGSLAAGAGSPLPAIERYFFAGNYHYYRSEPVRCTFKRSDSSSMRFEVHWLAHWATKGEEEGKWGKHDNGWYKYQGPLTLHEDGTVTGKAKYHKVTGSWSGRFPAVTMELEYTGGRKEYDGPRTMTLTPAKPPSDRSILVGEITGIDWRQGTAIVRGVALDKTGKPLAGEDPAAPGDHAVALQEGFEQAVGRYEVGTGFLHKGQRVKVAGLKVEEGTLAMQVLHAEPVVHVGTIVSVSGDKLTATLRPKSERKAEPVSQELGLAFLSSIKPAKGRAKTIAAGIATLSAGQELEVTCLERGGRLEAIALKARAP